MNKVDLDVFAGKVTAMIAAHYTSQMLRSMAPTVTVHNIGPKFARLARSDGSVYCFIDLSNGDIRKAAGWKAPAKHARGNIYNENALQGCTIYGAEYMR